MINVGLLRAGLGNSVASIGRLNHYGYTPNQVQPPCFFPVEVTFDLTAAGHRTFGTNRGYEVTCRLLTSRADDLSGQALLDKYLSEGSTDNIVEAIQADQTLGGIAASVFVHHIDGYRLYTVGADVFYGATFRVQVLG
jgi:hypothetical protein